MKRLKMLEWVRWGGRVKNKRKKKKGKKEMIKFLAGAAGGKPNT